MVQITSVAVALVLVAPSLAAPLHHITARSSELDTREPVPNPSLKGLWNTAKKVAHNPTVRKAAKVASWFIREDGTALSARELEPFEDLTQRDVEMIDDLVTRNPKFGSWLKKAARTVGRYAKPAMSVASNFIRREDAMDALELSERDYQELEELAARDPKFGRWLKKAVGTVSRFAKPAMSIASKFIREDDEEVLSREEHDDLFELAARDPKFGSWLKKAARTVGRYAKPAMSMASNFIREDDEEVFTREDEEAFLELAARDPKFGSWLKKAARTVGRFAKPAAKIAGSILFREDSDELLSREETDAIFELAARDPKFGSWLKKAARTVGRYAKPAMSVASNFIREDAELEDLMAREYYEDYEQLD